MLPRVPVPVPPGQRHARLRVQRPTLWVPIIHPCWSGSMLVFVEDAAEPVPSPDIEVRESFRIGNRFRERA